VIDKDLLEILACPETHQSLAEASKELLKRVNDAIAAGSVQNRGGKKVEEPLAAGLVRQDGTIVYPIRDEIPVLLIDEGIPVPGTKGATSKGS
jgi:uncharacterized protein YbaR (Trm112 family)